MKVEDCENSGEWLSLGPTLVPEIVLVRTSPEDLSTSKLFLGRTSADSLTFDMVLFVL